MTVVEIAELHARAASLLDDGPLDAWPDLFTDDCFYRVVSADDFDRGLPLGVIRCESRAMLKDRVRAVQELSMYVPRRLRHVVGHPMITSAAGAAGAGETAWSCTASFVVFQALPGAPVETLVAGRYVDDIVREDGGLRYRSRQVVYDNALIPNSIVMPL